MNFGPPLLTPSRPSTSFLPMNNTVIVNMLYSFTHLSEHCPGPVFAHSPVILADSFVNQVQQITFATVLHDDVHTFRGPELLEHTGLKS